MRMKPAGKVILPKSSSLTLALIAAVSFSAGSAESGKLSITVYSDGFAVVSEQRALEHGVREVDGLAEDLHLDRLRGHRVAREAVLGVVPREALAHLLLDDAHGEDDSSSRAS